MCGVGLKLVETDEYSESGRGVYPDGLYRVLLMFHQRYKHLKVPFIVTENGVSDETDVIRRPYIIEHLLALYAAMLKVKLGGKKTLGIGIAIVSLCVVAFHDRVFRCSVTYSGLFQTTGNGLMDMVQNLDLLQLTELIILLEPFGHRTISLPRSDHYKPYT